MYLIVQTIIIFTHRKSVTCLILIIVLSEHFTYKHCVSSRISYGLKRLIPSIFFYHFVLSYVYFTVMTIDIFKNRRSSTCSFSISVICECCKDKLCVWFRSIYGIKQVTPWHFFLDHFILSYVYLTLQSVVLFTHIIGTTCSFSRSVLFKCCKDEQYVGSRSIYIPKWGISCNFFIVSSYHMCIFF